MSEDMTRTALDARIKDLLDLLDAAVVKNKQNRSKDNGVTPFQPLSGGNVQAAREALAFVAKNRSSTH